MTARVHKLINQPENLVDEMLEGFCAAHSDIVRLVDKRLVMRARPKAPGKSAWSSAAAAATSRP